jgi:CRP/FNR family transcriptional regulator
MKPWFLEDTGIIERMSEEELMVLSRICPKYRYIRGDVLYHAGEPATNLHIIIEGQVKLVAFTPGGKERIFAICGPQDLIGEAFLPQDAHYGADAVALTEIVTCPVSRQQFLELSLHLPQFVLVFAELVVGYLTACRQQLEDVYAPVKLRLVKVLLEQAQRFGASAEDGWVELHTELSHDELAAMIGATRVSVSLAMAGLRKQGLLESSHRHYRLHAPALETLLEG